MMHSSGVNCGFSLAIVGSFRGETTGVIFADNLLPQIVWGYVEERPPFSDLQGSGSPLFTEDAPTHFRCHRFFI